MTGSWNYRVIEFKEGGALCRQISEVYYENNVPYAYTEDPAGVSWNDVEGDAPHETLERMKTALDKPVLTEEDFKSFSD